MKTLEKNTQYSEMVCPFCPNKRCWKAPQWDIRIKNTNLVPATEKHLKHANNLRNNCYSLGISAASYHLRYNLKSFLISVPKNALPKNCNKQIPLQIKKQGNISVYHKTWILTNKLKLRAYRALLSWPKLIDFLTVSEKSYWDAIF